MNRMWMVCIASLLAWDYLVITEAEVTVPDNWYDAENLYILDSYDFGTDEPAPTPDFSKVASLEDWHFAYNGSTIKVNKYPSAMSQEQRAIVWPLGIKGIDSYGRVSQETNCMGVLVHPEILMTLCACVNSWTLSYRNLKSEEAVDEAFHVSDTSDEDYDIRRATLFAQRTTWLGFAKLTGDVDRFPILRRVIPYTPCLEAITSDNETVAFGQFKTVAFLQLATAANHPVSGVIQGFFDRNTDQNLAYWSRGYYDVRDYQFKLNIPKTADRANFGPYDAYSYFQRVQDYVKNDLHYRPASFNELANEPMDVALQLLGVGLKEEIVSVGKEPPSCKYNELYSHTYEHIKELSRDEDFTQKKFKAWLLQPNVACFTRLSPIPLCDVAPGSPVVYGGKMYGMVMSRPPVCSEQTKTYAVFVLMFVEEHGFGPELEKDIKHVVGDLEDLRRRENEALLDPVDLDGTEPVVDFVGHLDGELVPVFAKELINHYIKTIEPIPDKTSPPPSDYDESQFEGGAEVYFDPRIRSKATAQAMASILVFHIIFRTLVQLSIAVSSVSSFTI